MTTPDKLNRQVAEDGTTVRRMIGGCFTLLLVLLVILGAIKLFTGGFRWISTRSKESSIPYDQVYAEAKGELGGGENGWGWTINYVIHNDSSKSVDLSVNMKLPVTFSDCQVPENNQTTVYFQIYSTQPIVIQASIPPNQSVSGTTYATYSEGDGRTLGYYTCWQSAGCDSYYGCQQYEIGTPVFTVQRETLPSIELRANRLP
jgi:hypothetical protein